MRFLLLVSLVSTALCVPPVWYLPGGCGVSKYPDAGDYDLPARIVGGIPADPHEFPWQASLRNPSGSGHFCGGSLINERWVVTAAHCVNGDTPSSLSVVLGAALRSSPDGSQTTNTLEAIFVHELYDSSRFNFDIALLKLSADVALTEDVWPVCAPDADFNYDWTKAAVSGWGTVMSGGAILPDELRYTTVNVTTNDVCLESYPGDITDDMICAGDNNGFNDRDSCQGDSGGPMMYKRPADSVFELNGIVSWGFGCASGSPGVYARVTFFNDWVTNKIQKN